MKTNLLKIALFSVIAGGTVFSSVAQARDRDDRYDRYDRDHRHYRRDSRGHRVVVVEAPRRVVVSRPVVIERPIVVERGGYSRSVEFDVQRALAKRGYYGGILDGDIGPRTRAAIRTYQVDKGLAVTGMIDGGLLRSLRLL